MVGGRGWPHTRNGAANPSVLPKTRLTSGRPPLSLGAANLCSHTEGKRAVREEENTSGSSDETYSTREDDAQGSKTSGKLNPAARSVGLLVFPSRLADSKRGLQEKGMRRQKSPDETPPSVQSPTAAPQPRPWAALLLGGWKCQHI